MTPIEQLILDLCPNGVPVVKLGDCCTFKRGSTITAKDAREGDIPVIAGGQKPAYYHDEYNRLGETITVAGSGAYAGYVAYWNIPIFVSDAFTVEFCDGLGVPKYLYYFLKSIQDKIHNTKKGSGVPHVHPSSIADFPLPLPPRPLQEKIVEILDKFSLLSAELEAELEGQKKRYEYYRTRLLSFDSDSDTVQWKTLGEVCKFSQGTQIDKELQYEEQKPNTLPFLRIIDFTQGNEPPRYVSDEYKNYLLQKDDIAMVRYGAVGFVCTGKYGVLANNLFKITPNESISNRYLYYYLKSTTVQNLIKGASQEGGLPAISFKTMAKIPIPIPSLERQAEIVRILDKFETLVTDLSQGLPAEIQLVQHQYEYYRNKLLTFNPSFLSGD